MHRTLLVFALIGTAAAQDAPPDPADIRALLDLPEVADEMREHGVDNNDVVEALRAGHESRLKGRELGEMMRATDRLAVEKGAVQGMGGFVREALAEGKRGQDLADAIRAAHDRRGGPPDIRGGGAPGAGGGDKPGAGGPGTRGGGKPDAGGAPGTRSGGKPDAGGDTPASGRTRGGGGDSTPAPSGDTKGPPAGTRTRGGTDGAPSTTPQPSSPPTRTRGG